MCDEKKNLTIFPFIDYHRRSFVDPLFKQYYLTESPLFPSNKNNQIWFKLRYAYQSCPPGYDRYSNNNCVKKTCSEYKSNFYTTTLNRQFL